MARKPSPTLDHLGASLGPRIAQLVTDAVVDTHGRLTDHKIMVGRQAAEALLELIGDELGETLGPLLTPLAGAPGLDPHTARLLRDVATRHGEAFAAARAAVAFSGVGASIGTYLTALMAPAVQHLLTETQNALHDPATAASLVALNIIPNAQGVDEAARQNLEGARFEDLVVMAQNPPGVPDLITLANRGAISDADFDALVLRTGMPPVLLPAINRLRVTPLAPADLADMVVRGILTEADAAPVAGATGITPEDFHRLVLDTGEPLALEQLLLLYRRGQIDEATLTRGIRQSRVRDEWIPAAIDLRVVPAAAADVIRAAVQNQLPIPEAQHLFEVAGMDPATWPWMLASAGRPPGIAELIQLHRRGIVSTAVVEQAVRESDIKDKYIPDIVAMTEYVPPPRSVPVLLREGAITDAQAATLLAADGLTPELIHAELTGAHRTRTAAAHTLARSTVIALYHDRGIDEATAASMLGGLGYTPADVGFLLAVEDLHREAVFLERAIGHVHTLYVGHKLDRPQTTAALADLGVPATQVTALLRTWDLERVAAAPQLTAAEIAAALRYAIITEQDALDSLAKLGWGEHDAWVFLATHLHHALASPEPAG